MTPTLPPPAAKSAPGLGTPWAEEVLPLRFGKYTLLRRLGAGGMAELFIALQRSMAGFEKLVVIKRILPGMNSDPAFVEMLMQEARIAATLSHPSLVQIFDVGQTDGTFFIAMEHIDGEDLRSVTRQLRKMGVAPLPLEHAVGIVLRTAAGLAYAHEARGLDGARLGIVHRDISPHNVVVTFTGDVKIVDFGIATAGETSVADASSGKLRGKIPYMSPEQARGEVLDARADIFSLGILLFELTTGHRLFKATSEFETLKLICEREYPKPSALVPDYPKALEAIVMRALARDKEARFESARALEEALEGFIREAHLPVSTIALSRFMESLFRDKLAAQKSALREGKHLADIILQGEDRASVAEFDSQSRVPDSLLPSRPPVQSPPSTPAGTVRTIPPESPPQVRPRRRVSPALFGLAGVVAGALAMWVHATPRSLSQANDSTRSGPRAPTLSVDVQGGGCLLTIDGVDRGRAPVEGLSIEAGVHVLSCSPNLGPPLSSTLEVAPEGPSRYTFQLPR